MRGIKLAVGIRRAVNGKGFTRGHDPSLMRFEGDENRSGEDGEWVLKK